MSERKAIFCVWLLFCVLASASAETIVLKSGNAAIGERDPLITVVGKEVTIAGQEASAAVQPLEQALVVSALDATWATPAPGSCWVGVSQNAACNQGGYEYSTPIDLPLFYADPSFEITVTADNYYAVYLNGVLVGQQATAGLFTELFTHSITSDSAFRPGRNDLIIQVINRTDQPPTPTGLTFSATVTYTPDTTPPLDPTVTDDGPLTADPTQLQASWSSSDPESGIAEYQYAIGTSATDPGSGYVVDWKSAGTATEATETGLSLLPWQTYYWYVKAKNGAGLWSEVGTSDGVLLEPTARVPFREDFDTLDSAVWMSYANGGNISLSDGKLSLSAPGIPSTFPYLHLKVNPFPSTGDFTMRIRMKFNSLGGYGTGLQTTTAAPPNGPLAPDLNVTWGWWADVARSPGKDYHDVAWHYSNGQVTQSVDGVPSAAVETALPRCILLGNFWAVPGGYSWTSFEIDYIEVVADDTTPPATPAVSDDGTITASSSELHASWSSDDAESGIAEYQYAIGTSASDPGSGYVVDWKSAGTATEATESGLSLLPWQTYYWYVKAKNGAGLWSEVGTSDGVLLEPTARVPFREDFDTLDSAVWMSYANGGNISLSDGKLSLSAPGIPSTFPYLHLKVNPFPSTGDFTMRIRMKFNSLGGYGTGLQTTTAAPPNGPLAPDLNVTWGWWADVARSPGKDYHDVAWHYSNGQVTQSVDGVPSAAVETALPRCILLGNFWAVPGGYSWTSFEIDYIEVVPDDTTPPATPAVSDDGAVSASSSELHASWSSDDAESGIAEYLYAIGTSPTDSGSGYLVGWKSAGTATEATEAGLSLAPATTYFWYVKARNGVGLWSEVGVSDGIKVAGQVVMTPGAAKLLPDGTAVGLLGARVTATSAVMSGRVYVEDALRSSGIAALSSAEVTEGDVVNVAGLMATNADGERIISVATVVVTGHETPLAPVVTNLRCAASGPWFYQTASGLTVKGQRGVTDPPGEEMNTIGLLLQVHGVVMDMDGSFVFLNDGAWADRTGVRVLRANLPPEPTVGDYVRLTGISSMRKTSTAYQLVIRPRRSSDLEVIVPASEGLLQNSLWRALLKL